MKKDFERRTRPNSSSESTVAGALLKRFLAGAIQLEEVVALSVMGGNEVDGIVSPIGVKSFEAFGTHCSQSMPIALI